MQSEARKIVKGMGWVSAASYLNRAFGFITTLILARVLAPDQFGAIAVGAMMVDALKIFRDMGMGQALIYRKDEQSIANDTALVLIMCLNGSLLILGVIAAPFVARFFSDESLTPVLIVMSGNLIPIGLRAVPDALIRRHGRFDKLAIPEVVPVLVSSIVGIVLALLGYGVWSLVVRTILASLLAAILIWFFVDYRPSLRFDRKIAREMFSYGKFVVGATLLNVVLLNLDKLYLGRFGGIGDLGIYTMAWVISSIPVTEFGHLLCRVAFPVFCQMNTDRDKLRQIFIGSHAYNALIVSPLAAGIAIFGPDLSRLFLGNKWSGIATALQLLAIASFSRAISALIHELFRATGQVRVVQTFTFTRLLLLAILGIPALHFGGMSALCLLVLSSNLVVLCIELRMSASAVGASATDVVWPLLKPATLATASIGSVFLVYRWIDNRESLVLAVAAALISAALYLGAVVATQPNIVSDARRLFSRAK
jgi:O-antigen/teichoic acid export membrane protein